MGSRRRFGAFVAALAVLCLAVSAQARGERLTVLHFNDLYEIAPKRGKGGFAPLMTLLEAERSRAGGAALTTFGGDLISPSLMSGLTQGAQMIDLCNAVGVDVAVIGNHELDFGLAVLARRIAESRFPWLAANVTGRNGDRPAGLRATAIRRIGGVTVGLFGLLTPESATLARGGGELRFAPLMKSAAESVAVLRRAGAEVVVALTHLGLAQDRALARNVPGIDLILGGHDHYPVALMEGGVLILKAGSDAHYLGVVALEVARKPGASGGRSVTVAPREWRFVSTAGVAPHPDIARRVKAYESRLDAALGDPVGRTETALDSRRLVVRGQESTMGNLIADAMRAATGADIALVNGGGIRGDRVYRAGTTLTRRDMLSELPFGDSTVVLELTGAELRAALENGVSQAEQRAGRFLQVSGVSFAWDPAVPAGRRIGRITAGGAPLADGRSYRVATGAYIAGGGDGFAVLKGARRIVDEEAGEKIVTQVIRHIAAQGAVAPRIEGRITAARR